MRTLLAILLVLVLPACRAGRPEQAAPTCASTAPHVLALANPSLHGAEAEARIKLMIATCEEKKPPRPVLECFAAAKDSRGLDACEAQVAPASDAGPVERAPAP